MISICSMVYLYFNVSSQVLCVYIHTHIYMHIYLKIKSKLHFPSPYQWLGYCLDIITLRPVKQIIQCTLQKIYCIK